MTTTNKVLNPIAPVPKPETRDEKIAYINQHRSHSGTYCVNVKLTHDWHFPSQEVEDTIGHLVYEMIDGYDFGVIGSILNQHIQNFEEKSPTFTLGVRGRSGGFVCLEHKLPPGRGGDTDVFFDLYFDSEDSDEDINECFDVLYAFDQTVEDFIQEVIDFAVKYEYVEKEVEVQVIKTQTVVTYVNRLTGKTMEEEMMEEKED